MMFSKAVMIVGVSIPCTPSQQEMIEKLRNLDEVMHEKRNSKTTYFWEDILVILLPVWFCLFVFI